MNGTDPWITDLRRSGYQQTVSRTGLPALPQYTLRSFRIFVGKLWVTFLLAVATVSVLYCSKVLQSQKMTIKPKADYQLQEDKQEKSDILFISDQLQAHTLLGDIFSNNPDIFYSIHPLLPILDECNSLNGRMKANYMYNHFNCLLMNQSNLFSEVGLSTDPKSHPSPLRECLTENFCFRKQNLRFCSGRLCNARHKATADNCGPVDIQLASQYCRRSKLRAVAVGRASCDHDCLQDLTQERNINVKIVVIDCQNCKDNKKVCPGQLKSFEDSLETFEHLPIKLEDLEEDPVAVTKEICKYAGHTSLCRGLNFSNRLLRRRRRETMQLSKRRN